MFRERVVLLPGHGDRNAQALPRGCASWVCGPASKEAAGLARERGRGVGNEVRTVPRAQMVRRLLGHRRTESVLRAVNNRCIHAANKSLWLLRGGVGAKGREECVQHLGCFLGETRHHRQSTIGVHDKGCLRGFGPQQWGEEWAT